MLDPVNFDNHVAKHYILSDRDRLVTAAAEALDAISTAYYEPAKGQAAELWQDVLGTGFRAAAALSSYTYAETFTRTHARRLAGRVTTDLRQSHLFWLY